MNKQQRVYSIIRERILEGAYGPGYRLVIDRIADEFGVSALPVREAVRRMEAEGLVVFRPNAGAQVTPADPSLYEENMTVLAVLEGYATAQAAPRMDAGQLRSLDQETDAMVSCMETLDVLGFSRANQRFHRHIHDACGNPPLLELLRNTERRLDAIRRTVFTHIPYRGVSSIEDHREIVHLIRAGVPAAEIEAEARAHKLRTIDAFREWMAEHPPDRDLQATLAERPKPQRKRSRGATARELARERPDSR
jgi:DNA-binding GntR family transcriptional regulator